MRQAADIALLAVYPPPWGGVANHVHRLSALLDERALTHTIYNAVSDSTDGRHVEVVAHRRTSWLLRYAATGRERLVYVFSDRLAVWLTAAAMTARGKRVVVRLRNKALPEYLADPKTRALASLALRRVDHVVAVSRALADAARDAGVPADRVLHQPGFLPPLASTRDAGLSPAQAEHVASHEPIVAANGKVSFHQGVDVYGLDLLVEAVARLVPRFPRLGLAVSFWDHLPADEPHLDRLRARASELGVASAILFHTESRPFVPVLERADLFVRPTSTDGDANSVREALYIGVPTIASDVVARPPGTRLVRTRDLDALVEAMRTALENRGPRRPDPSVVDLAGVDRYLGLLARLAGDRGAPRQAAR